MGRPGPHPSLLLSDPHPGGSRFSKPGRLRCECTNAHNPPPPTMHKCSLSCGSGCEETARLTSSLPAKATNPRPHPDKRGPSRSSQLASSPVPPRWVSPSSLPPCSPQPRSRPLPIGLRPPCPHACSGSHSLPDKAQVPSDGLRDPVPPGLDSGLIPLVRLQTDRTFPGSWLLLPALTAGGRAWGGGTPVLLPEGPSRGYPTSDLLIRSMPG